MKALLKKIRIFCIVAVLSVSLTVSNTAASIYQAAAIPVVYTGWQTLVTILALLGITICAAPDISEDEAAQELVDKFVGWKVLNGDGQGDSDGDGEDDLYSTFDPLDYLTSNNQLQMSQEELEAWQQFYYENMAPEVVYKPSDSSVNLYGCTYQEYLDYMKSTFGLTESLDKRVKNFLLYSYNTFVECDYSGFLASRSSTGNPSYTNIDTYTFYKIYSDKPYRIVLTDDRYLLIDHLSITGTTAKKYFTGIYHFTDYSIPNDGSSSFWSGSVNQSMTVFYPTSTNHIKFFVHGQLYDFYEVFSFPQDISTDADYGNIVYFSDFKKSVNNLGTGLTDVVNTVGDLDLFDALQNQSFDVIGNGREWDDNKQQAVGDITVPMPSPDILAAYQSGLITYEQLLEGLGITPIDEATGTNLLTQELIDTNKGIFAGINSLVNFVQQIISWLNNFFDSLVQALIDMIMSLLVPGDGFIEGKIGEITDKLDSLGVAPYDMSGIFDSDDGNPFKNITIDVNGREVVIVSFDYLPPFLDKFRPVIRGLLVLFLIYYSINQLLSLIRLSGMMEGGNSNQLSIQGSTVPKIEDKGGRL